jgi:hypothetical protein
MIARTLARLRILVIIGISGLLALPGGCGKSPATPTTPTAPIDLNGTWSGQLARPGAASAFRLTWVALHRGDAVAGTVTLVDPASDLQASGIMSGVFNGNRLTLTFAVAPGRIQGFERCGFAGRGDASATTNEITGSIALLSLSCAGTGLEDSASRELRLSR